MSMRNTFCDLAFEPVNGLFPYQAGKPIDELQREFGLNKVVKLASNENPLGPSSAVKTAIKEALNDISQYPDGSGFYLKEALSKKLDVSADMITLGNGSNNILDVIARVFLSSEREAIYSEYAFVVYAMSTQAVGATARIAKATDYGHDLSAMAELVNEKTSVVFIANPNNPTGTLLDAGELELFIEAMPPHVIVVLDEAYYEYLQQSNVVDSVAWLQRYRNLIITRTFSKAYGLAGLRVGYSLSHPDIADLLNRVRSPFNVNSLALVAAQAAVQDVDYIKRSQQLNQQGLAQLASGFEKLGLSYIPSVGNFISVKIGGNASDVYLKLLQEGIIVRPIAAYNMPDYLRVSVGLADENGACLTAMAKVLKNV